MASSICYLRICYILDCFKCILTSSFTFQICCSNLCRHRICSWKSRTDDNKCKGNKWKINVSILQIMLLVNNNSGWKFQDNVTIGRMPIMLRSCRCVLHGKDEEELARLGLYFTFISSLAYFCYITFIVFCFGFQVSAHLILEDILSSKEPRR